MFRRRTPDVARLVRRRDVQGLLDAVGYRESESVRSDAARALGELADQRAVGPLLNVVATEPVPVAATAMAALDRLDSAGCRIPVPELLQALDHQSWKRSDARGPEQERGANLAIQRLSQDARAVLARRVSSDDIPAVVPMLDDSRWDVRTIGVETLTAISDPAVLPHLVAFLARDASDLPWRAFDAIASFRDPSTVDALAEHMRHAEVLTEDMVAAFSEIDSPAVDRHLESLLERTTDREHLGAIADVVERRSVLPSEQRAKLAVMRGDYEAAAAEGGAGLEGVLAVTRHASRDVRHTAVVTLLRVPDPRSIDALVECLHDDASNVRSTAISALIEIADSRVVSILLGLFDSHPDHHVRRMAAIELGKRGDRQAVERLALWLNSIEDEMDPDIITTDEQDQITALTSIGRLGGDAAIDILLGVLASPNPQLRAAAARALGFTGDRRALEPLLECLTDPDITRDAVYALGDLGERRAVPALCALLLSENNSIYLTEAAAFALMKIGDPSALPALREIHEGHQGIRVGRLMSDNHAHDVLRRSVEQVREAIKALESRPGES